MIGTIVKSTGNWYMVRREDASSDAPVVACRIKGKFKLRQFKLTNPVAVGDREVIAVEPGQETALITEILPRRNYVARQSPSRKHSLHLLAANIDQAILIVTLREPNVKLGFVDRFLLTTEPHDIPTVIVFNKIDIHHEAENEYLTHIKSIYSDIGYTLLETSAATGAGLDEFKAILHNKTTLVAGHSGVGKSTLVNAIQPQLTLRTSEISDYSGKGQHTTTFAELYELSFGGRIIDTPGIKELAFIELTPREVAHNFKEIFVSSAACKYQDCQHINEPFCAVKADVQRGHISETRYQNYLNIIGEIAELNNWEIHKGGF